MHCGARRCLLIRPSLTHSRCVSAAAVPNRHFDVAIVGAGLTGAALAAGLGANKLTRDLRIALVDRQEPASIQHPQLSPPANRVSTLTPASIQFLTEIGAWPDIAPPRSAPFSRMQVWDSTGSDFVQYDAATSSEVTMGHVAENGVIQYALMQRLRPNVYNMWPAIVKALELPPFSPTQQSGTMQSSNAFASLQLEGGSTIKAKLVVGSDGGNSNVFLPNGPLALLPVRDGFSNIVWSTTPAQAAELEAMTPTDFVNAVNMALSGGPRPSSVLGGMTGARASSAQFEDPPVVTKAVGQPPKSFPLVLCHAGRYVRPRLALIGDAAHTVHPLAGQGVNLGFGDVKALVDAIAHATETGMDIGSMTVLEEEYERPRQQANISMTAALNGLKRVFEPQTGLTARIRSIGLGLLNDVPFAKDKIMQYAMGR
ncbi:hypothetical protein WJX82_002364 [Trebouxia sp. C0006]